MGLRGQGCDRWDDRGYAMAALLVALAVMSVLLSVAMPVWRQEAQREKEAELVWRGEQYARAIALYRAKNQQLSGQPGGQVLPPSIDVLVQGRFLRKKYKDPMTKDGEFVVINFASQATPGGPTAPGPGRGPTPNPIQPPPNARSLQPGGGMPQQGGVAVGGIQGVRSKSQETSLRTYRGATRYDQWAFMYTNVPRPGGMPAATPGGPNPGMPPGGPGGPGSGPRGGRNPGINDPTRNNMPPFGGTAPSPGGRPGRGGRGPGL